MLINKEKKIIVWQPFKNYSTSIANYLTSNRIFGKEKFIFVQGPVPYFHGDTKSFDHLPSLGHTNWLPETATEYTRILPIRNPYSRVVSQWKEGLKYDSNLDFDHWFLVHSKQQIQFPVTKLYRYDKLIKVENIEQELRDLSLFNEEHEFPHSNKSDDSDFELSERHKEIIYHMHYSDFDEGQYEK